MRSAVCASLFVLALAASPGTARGGTPPADCDRARAAAAALSGSAMGDWRCVGLADVAVPSPTEDLDVREAWIVRRSRHELYLDRITLEPLYSFRYEPSDPSGQPSSVILHPRALGIPGRHGICGHLPPEFLRH